MKNLHVLVIMFVAFASNVTIHSAAQSQLSPAVSVIVQQLVTVETDGKKVVRPHVAKLLRNDGLFTLKSGSIALEDAVGETQRIWFNKEGKYAPTAEDRAKSQRIDQGNRILKELYNQGINETAPADLIVAHGGVLPSVIKMLLAVKEALETTGARKLIIITHNESFNEEAIRATTLEQYAQAAQLLGESAFPTVTQETKPQNQKEVVELVLQSFASTMADVAIEYVDKRHIADFVQTIQTPTNVAIASAYPLLEAHVLTLAVQAQINPHLRLVSGITAGPHEELEPLYGTQMPEARYNFDRNNFARVLYSLSKYYNSAQ